MLPVPDFGMCLACYVFPGGVGSRPLYRRTNLLRCGQVRCSIISWMNISRMDGLEQPLVVRNIPTCGCGGYVAAVRVKYSSICVASFQ